MSVHTPLAVTDPEPAPAPAPDAAPGGRRLDRFELGLLALFGAISTWVVALDVWHAISNGLVWTGTDGFYIVDQMQYLAWIQSASHHLLASNLFVLRSTPSDYFRPAIAISGILVALGVVPWLALLLWKPIAVIGFFLAIRAVAHSSFADRGAQRAALTLGLLFSCFTIVLGSFGIVGDLMPDWLSWGYPFALMAVALIVFGLLRYDRARGAARLDWRPGLLGAVAGTLHPWQGEIMIMIIVGAELVRWRDLRLWWQTRQWRRLGLPVLTLAIAGLPLIYYVLLGKLDINWSLAREASKHAFSFATIAIAIAPLAAFAALGYRRHSDSFLELALRVWAPAAVIIYIVSATGLSATPLHAFDGITIPLAVLAVKGVRRSRLRVLRRGRLVAVTAIVLGVVPANVYALATAHSFVDPTPGNANFITTDERAALTYLDRDRQPGGVLTSFYLGEVVPARTGRHTYVGDCLWSEPGCNPDAEQVQALFDGTLSRQQSQQFVTSTGARFVLAGCEPRVNLDRKLRPLIASTERFGCAVVFTLQT
ncbi:MAG: hypothetical protein ACLP50_29775 [Solirubrobacteraceae bacterium]